MFTLPAPSSPSEPVIAGGPQIPVLDKTGLTGIFDFSVDMRPELGTDGFAMGQRVLRDQLGLRCRKPQRKCSHRGCGRRGKNPDGKLTVEGAICLCRVLAHVTKVMQKLVQAQDFGNLTGRAHFSSRSLIPCLAVQSLHDLASGLAS